MALSSFIYQIALYPVDNAIYLLNRSLVNKWAPVNHRVKPNNLQVRSNPALDHSGVGGGGKIVILLAASIN